MTQAQGELLIAVAAGWVENIGGSFYGKLSKDGPFQKLSGRVAKLREHDYVDPWGIPMKGGNAARQGQFPDFHLVTLTDKGQAVLQDVKRLQQRGFEL